MNRQELYMEIFGTPAPSPVAVRKWQRDWVKNSEYRVRCSSRIEASRRLKALNIDPLVAVNGLVKGTTSENFVMVFYNQEDYMAYTLHYV